jgi:hypothetical protein
MIWDGKIVLVNPPTVVGAASYLAPPIGLLQVAAALQYSYPQSEIAILDLALELAEGNLSTGPMLPSESADLLFEQAANTYAFSVQCFNLPLAIAIAKRLKATLPDCRIVFGGHHATLLGDRIVKSFDCVDEVVCGSGEVAIAPNAGNWVKPAFHLSGPLERYANVSRLPTGIIELSRGCPFRCTYCSIPDAFGRTVRHKPLELVRDEIETWLGAGFINLHLVDDILTVNSAYVAALTKTLRPYTDRLSWSAMTRADLVDADILRDLGSAGCDGLLYGIDSGSPATLSLIQKRAIRYPEKRDLVRWHQEARIYPTYYFLTAVPGESEADIRATLIEAAKLSVLDPGSCRINAVRLVPGTPMTESLIDRLDINLDSPYADTLMETVGNDCDEVWSLVKHHPTLFSTYFSVPTNLGIETTNFLARFGSALLERAPLSIAWLATSADAIGLLSKLALSCKKNDTVEVVMDQMGKIFEASSDSLAEMLRFERWRGEARSNSEDVLFSRVSYSAAAEAFVSEGMNAKTTLSQEARLFRISA